MIRARPAVAAGLLCLAAVTLPAPSNARRLFVPQEHRTIQAAIDSAAAGDTVWVSAGTYPGTIRITKRLVVFGAGGPDSTILDGGDSVRVVHVEGVTVGHLLGFTIRRGKAPGGGGVYCLRDTSFVISSCRIEKNWESGVSLWQCVGMAFMDNDVRDNQGSGLVLSHSTVYLRRARFLGNRAPAGGAILLDRSETMSPIQDCLFEDNRSESGPGGAILADSSLVRVLTSTFSGNRAHVAGGAIALMNHSELSMGRSVFSENRAGTGGAVHGDQSLMNIAGSIFDRNHSAAFGAAIQILGRSAPNVNPVLTDNTYYKNAGDSRGAAIYCENVIPEIRKSIFVVEGEQRAVLAPRLSPLYECNLLHDLSGHAGDSLPSATTYVGDPRFCDPEKGDFRVRDLSPAFLATCGPIGAMKQPCSSFKTVPSR